MDNPPRNIALVNQDCNPADCRTLDTEILADTIRDEIQNTTDAGQTTITGIEMSSPELSHDLLRRLLTAWAVIAKRNFPRSEKHEHVLVAIGLSASHQIICDSAKRRSPHSRSRAKDKPSPFSGKANYDIADVNSVNAAKPDVWDLVYPTELAKGYTALDADKVTKVANKKDDLLYHAESWAILNESASGYCIQNKSNSQINVQVGELVSIRRSGDGHTWKWGIGVTRWMKYSENCGVTLGIEMLTPDAAAVGIKAVMDDADVDYQRTLMLPELNAINQPSTIVTNPVPFRVGQQLKLRIVGKEVVIKLSKQLQNTGLFAQFQYDMMDSDHPNDDSGWQEESDFTQVWSII